MDNNTATKRHSKNRGTIKKVKRNGVFRMIVIFLPQNFTFITHRFLRTNSLPICERNKTDQTLSKKISTSNFHSIEYFFVLFVCVFYVFLCGLLFAYILILILTKYMKSIQQKRLMDKNISLKNFNFL